MLGVTGLLRACLLLVLEVSCGVLNVAVEEIGPFVLAFGMIRLDQTPWYWSKDIEVGSNSFRQIIASHYGQILRY